MFEKVFIVLILAAINPSSSSLLQCSNSWCYDDQTTTVDRVRDGVYVTYVCRIPDTSIGLRWEVSTGETHFFIPTELIGTTVVSNDDIFFYTLIDNGTFLSLASSLSFNFTADTLNGTVISCTDLSTMDTNTTTVVSQGSSSLLQCSNSWCNDDQTTTVDRVRDGVYVTYVSHVSDNSTGLKWNVSMPGASETRIFIPSGPIGTTVVVDDIFFYTVIDNEVSLASSLSFNFTDSLNGIVISCTDQSNMDTNIIAVVSQDIPPMKPTAEYDCNDNMVTVTWNKICFDCHYKLTVTYNNSVTVYTTGLTSMDFNVITGNILVIVSAIDQSNTVIVTSDPVSFTVEAPMDISVALELFEGIDELVVFMSWSKSDTSDRAPIQEYTITSVTFEDSTNITTTTDKLYHNLTIDRDSTNNLIVNIIVMATNCIGSTVIHNETINVDPVMSTVCLWCIIVIIVLAIILVLIVIILLIIIATLCMLLKRKKNKPNPTAEIPLEEKPHDRKY